MAAQFTLFNTKDYCPHKIRKKRIHFRKPTYTKSYDFYSVNPDTKEIQYLGDEKHIFRIKALQRIHSLLYGYCNIELFRDFGVIEVCGLNVFREDLQAEIIDTWKLPIYLRIKIHIKLLKLLRKKVSLPLAVRVAKYYLKSRLYKGL